jgi:hypothetical protein
MNIRCWIWCNIFFMSCFSANCHCILSLLVLYWISYGCDLLMVGILFVKAYRMELVHCQYQFHTIILTKPAKIKYFSSLHYITAHRYTTTPQQSYIRRLWLWWPITVAARSKTRTLFVRSNTDIVGWNPTWSTDFCVRLFCLYCSACR